ncbi:WecB/TagA/CpsF family glycosyltransferase [Carnimonas nigrificans]|uniref:WecB/TagA/CpsF family glycosyltransferase n=1 Tax=Carnimonas nigrificans TaxID=64323 RepID=UPI000470E639|nr:WecB/TagA/CpsF family glycosyltransferase [Carnimonas nigrificans]
MIFIQHTYTWKTGSDTSFINLFSLGEVKEQLTDQQIEHFRFYADGMLMVKALRFLRGKTVERTSFDDTSIAPLVFQKAVEEKLSVGLIGGGNATAAKIRDVLKAKYSELNIRLVSPGYFETSNQREKVITEAQGIDIIVIAMGGGRQERMLLELRDKGWQGTGFTCGGYFDQLVDADGEDYYPDFYDRHNLRWLYRLKKEPRRLLARYFVQYPVRCFKYIKFVG